MDGKQNYKLLPYEHQIIDALGISKEDYLKFVAIQKEYQDIKAGTSLDVRNWDAVAIVLIVVGTIMQVVAALIEEPPDQPRGQGAAQSRREEIFSPRYGFNSQQELAKYGDPVNLIYTNIDTNSQGGVRVATALLWSAVLSFGNSQLVRLMLAVGGGGIGAIDFSKTAFGDTSLKDFVSQNYWFYFKNDYTGVLRNDHLTASLGQQFISDPTGIGNSGDNPFRIRMDQSTAKDGFSHCYSPTSANVFGVYGAVPLNVVIIIRDAAGKFDYGMNEISLQVASGEGYLKDRVLTVGQDVSLTLKQAPNIVTKEEVSRQISANKDKAFGKNITLMGIEEAQDQRRSLTTIFDNSGVLKLGSVKLKIVSSTASDVVESDMTVKMKVIEKGFTPSIDYNDTASSYVTKEELDELGSLAKLKANYASADKKAKALLEKDDRPEIKTYEQLLEDGTIKSEKIITTEKVQKEIAPHVKPTTSYGKGNYTVSTFKDLPGKIFSCQEGFSLVAVKDAKGKVTSAVCRATVNENKVSYKIDKKLSNEDKTYLQSAIELGKIFNAKVNPLSNDLFFTKALMRIEEASYETNSPCHIVDFSIKARVHKKISGRAPVYGSDRVGSGYRDSDNGYKYRSSMFLVKVKTSEETDYTYMPCIFVVRRANEIDHFIRLRFISSLKDGVENARQLQFKFEPIFDVASELRNHPELRSEFNKTLVPYVYLENAGDTGTVLLTSNSSKLKDSKFEFTGKTRRSNLLPPVNEQPKDINEWDVFNPRSDTQTNFSFDNGPEFKLAAVTEQILDSFTNYTTGKNQPIYNDITLAGLNMYSGKSVSDVRSLTLFVTKGRKCKLLKTSGDGWGTKKFNYLPGNADGYANRAPDVFLDTVLDPDDGIGKYATIASVDIEQLARSKKFCEANGLFMDGVIADFSSWRQFWANNASFSLLELAKIGGRDTLLPGVPYNKDTGEITTNIAISALFNQGNIIEDSYKEEFIDFGENTQDAVVTIVYRKTSRESTFAQNATVQVQFADVVEQNASQLTIDASQFVTRKAQAIKIGKLICNTKRFSQKAIEFKTLPTDSPVFPGAFVYLELSHNQWDGIYTGTIENGNKLNMALNTTIPNGSNYSLLIYKQNSGSESTKVFNDVSIINNQITSGLNSSNYEGHLFIAGTAIKNKRVFRVTEVQMDGEGEVTVRAVQHATDANGQSLIARGIGSFVNGLFLIDGSSETSIIDV